MKEGKLLLIESTEGEGWMRLSAEEFQKLVTKCGGKTDIFDFEKLKRSSIDKLIPLLEQVLIEQKFDKGIFKLFARVDEDDAEKKFKVYYRKDLAQHISLLVEITEKDKAFIERALVNGEQGDWTVEFPQLN